MTTRVELPEGAVKCPVCRGKGCAADASPCRACGLSESDTHGPGCPCCENCNGAGEIDWKPPRPARRTGD
jgi:hypothetical protein